MTDSKPEGMLPGCMTCGIAHCGGQLWQTLPDEDGRVITECASCGRRLEAWSTHQVKLSLPRAESAFIHLFAAMTDLREDRALRVLSVLQMDDDLMSGLMGYCARSGLANNDSDWEFIGQTADPNVGDAWLHGGSGLPATHHLPEPGEPIKLKWGR